MRYAGKQAEPPPGQEMLWPDNSGIASMQADIEAAKQSMATSESGWAAAFDRALNETPDMIINVDGRDMTLRDVAEMFQGEDDILEAITTCSIGGAKP